MVRLRVGTSGDNQAGAETDPVDPTCKRVLVRFWAFTNRCGHLCAFGELHQRVRRDTGAGSHPLLHKYKYYQYTTANDTQVPFYALPVTSTVGAAVVFPDPDFRCAANRVERQVAYVPTVDEVGDGTSKTVPGEDFLPAVPQRYCKTSHRRTIVPPTSSNDVVSYSEGEEYEE